MRCVVTSRPKRPRWSRAKGAVLNVRVCQTRCWQREQQYVERKRRAAEASMWSEMPQPPNASRGGRRSNLAGWCSGLITLGVRSTVLQGWAVECSSNVGQALEKCTRARLAETRERETTPPWFSMWRGERRWSSFTTPRRTSLAKKTALRLWVPNKALQ